MDRTSSSNESYVDRLVRLIPAEVVAAYVAVQGLVAGFDTQVAANRALEVTACGLLVVLPLFAWRVQGVRSVLQIILAMGSFVVWAAAVSAGIYTGDLSTGSLKQDRVWTSIVLVLWTTLVPAFRVTGRPDQ